MSQADSVTALGGEKMLDHVSGSRRRDTQPWGARSRRWPRPRGQWRGPPSSSPAERGLWGNAAGGGQAELQGWGHHRPPRAGSSLPTSPGVHAGAGRSKPTPSRDPDPGLAVYIVCGLF